MRKVVVSAIQPQVLSASEPYNPYKPDYINDPKAILEHHVLPQIARTLELVRKAGEAGSDIVTTCEDTAGLGDFLYDSAEGNPFPALVKLSQAIIERELAALARQYDMYVVGCYFAELPDGIYNVATLFDRQGMQIGQYHKTHLPANEKWQCREGDSLDVFETDFGRVGMCICYDMMFPEPVQVLALKGAELILHPTFGYGWYDSIGEATLRTRANDHSVYIATAKNYVFNHAGKSSIIDHWGQVLAEAGFYPDAVVTQAIDLDRPKTHPDWHMPTLMSGIADVKLRMGRERRPEICGVITEPVDKLQIPDEQEQKRVYEGMKEGKYHW